LRMRNDQRAHGVGVLKRPLVVVLGLGGCWRKGGVEESGVVEEVQFVYSRESPGSLDVIKKDEQNRKVQLVQQYPGTAAKYRIGPAQEGLRWNTRGLTARARGQAKTGRRQMRRVRHPNNKERGG